MTEQEARAIAAPHSCPWPMSEDARKWVREAVEQTGRERCTCDFDRGSKCRCANFNRAEHERFMRSLR